MYRHINTKNRTDDMIRNVAQALASLAPAKNTPIENIPKTPKNKTKTIVTRTPT